jgi:hypothetical protein
MLPTFIVSADKQFHLVINGKVEAKPVLNVPDHLYRPAAEPTSPYSASLRPDVPQRRGGGSKTPKSTRGGIMSHAQIFPTFHAKWRIFTKNSFIYDRSASLLEIKLFLK